MNTQTAPQQPTAVPNFTLDHFADTVSWPAVAYGTPWNGWVTPIVTRETLEKFVEFLRKDEETMGGLREAMEGCQGPVLEWDGDNLGICGEWLTPREDSTYSFGFLGWTFISID